MEQQKPQSSLSKAKKILAYIFFPITIILIGLKFFMDNNSKNADKSLDKTEAKDHKLQLEEEKLKLQGQVHEDKADKIQADIDQGRKEGNDDVDWYKK